MQVGQESWATAAVVKTGSTALRTLGTVGKTLDAACGGIEVSRPAKAKRPGRRPRPLSIFDSKRLLFEAVVVGGVGLASGEIAVFVVFEGVDGDVFTLSLTLGFVGRTGDVDGDRHGDFRVQV